MTLSAEGEWNSTGGKLYMVGCVGFSNECYFSYTSHVFDETKEYNPLTILYHLKCWLGLLLYGIGT